MDVSTPVATIRELLEDVHTFLSLTLQNEVISSRTLTQKEQLLSRLSRVQNEFPDLQFKFQDAKFDKTRTSSPCPLSYIDMNVGSAYQPPSVSSDKSDSVDPSVAESDDYVSEEGKSIDDIAASELSSSDKCGYLEKKKSDTLKGWLSPFQKRWCVIQQGVLYYYEKSTDRRQKGSIILAGYEARRLPEDSKEGKKYSHCFELVCPGKRTYQFLATSDVDLHQWISAIDHHSKVFHHSENSSKIPKDESQAGSEDVYQIIDDDQSATIDETDDQSDQFFDYTAWYVGLWDCVASNESELSFDRGDMLHVLSKDYDQFSWWVAECNGKVGFVPKAYLMEAYEVVD